jgi:adenine-specific DNA-methyltransferase
MSSLTHREDLAGKVQMIYIDPPYGIRFGSNFQPEVGNREVKDKESDLTREPEMVRAYRDTWRLGVHSYLAYLRDRLMVSKELLADTGSIFVQIGDENVHLVRVVLDEIFGRENFMAQIAFSTTTGTTGAYLPGTCDYLLWFAKRKNETKYKQLYRLKELGGAGGALYTRAELADGVRRTITEDELVRSRSLPDGARAFGTDNLTSSRVREGRTGYFPIAIEGAEYLPGRGEWKTNRVGIQRLLGADRIVVVGETPRYVRYFNDFQAFPLGNLWSDVGGAVDKNYVVQTGGSVVQRCMLMTTDPGDLVLDPTCGSGTTAYVAEQWGRRWVTIDTSRVAIAIARQRLLTAKYDFYKLRTDGRVGAGFLYKGVTRVTLKSIAQNTNLDPIFAKHEPLLESKLAAANTVLKRISDKLRNDLRSKLVLKQKKEGKKAVTDADRRRLELPAKGNEWRHREVPFDTDPDYPADLKKAVEEYRAAWRAKMDEVNACIAANAEQEELVDQPEVDRKITRVSGPFTVEAVQPPEMSLGDAVEADAARFDGEPTELDETWTAREVQVSESAQNVEAYLAKMVDLLKTDGVRFPDNKQMLFTRLDAVYASGGTAGIHAEGRWVNAGETDGDPEGDASVGVVFGPQYGPITAKMVEEVIRPAARRFEDLVFAGFSFDGPAQAAIEEGHPRMRIHLAHIRPDVNPGMNGLLKEQPGSQLFTVFGRPRTNLDGPDSEGMYRLKMEGVDIYNPVTNAIVDTGATKVAAWFVDGDYDGRTFCITQAFFPDRSAWDKLSKALDGVVDPERFEAFSGTVSLPFAPGQHECAAVKVIDPRGNEVMRVHALRPEGK